MTFPTFSYILRNLVLINIFLFYFEFTFLVCTVNEYSDIFVVITYMVACIPIAFKPQKLEAGGDVWEWRQKKREGLTVLKNQEQSTLQMQTAVWTKHN